MNDKVVLITGASRGIGHTTALFLARKGYTVIANYNKSEKCAFSLRDQALKEHLSIDIVHADVSDRENVKKMIDYIICKYKKIDILINNAGISSFNLFTDITDTEWNTVLKNNLYSVFCVTQEVLPYMIHQKQGCIINISSVWAQVGASCESLYAVSKAGIDAITKSLAKELGPSNIRINSIAPGFIDTDMNANISSNVVTEIVDEIPLKKVGTPISIAKCIAWLIEDDYTTGQIISINGGWVIT